MNFLKKFQSGLNKTSTFLSSSIVSAFSTNTINQNSIDELETILLSSDIGLEVTNHLIKKIKSSKIYNKNPNMILKFLSNELELILKPREGELFNIKDKKPTVMIFIGVNGSGKTTTIGKLINLITKDKKILVAACDTFRAAAVEQLNVWASKKNTDFHQGLLQQDPASVAYQASVRSVEEDYDYLIIDTAGRLSNNTNLLNQLIKIKATVQKKIEKNNIKTILVLDGTNGSNMINQVEVFGKSMDVSGLIITKIDGTAKGGALISIAKNYEIPIHFVGLGEKPEDLYKFDAANFAKSMVNAGE